MSTTGGAARDAAAARRRRIAERGSERLALITGRVQTLSSSSSQSEPYSTPPCPTSVSSNSDQLPVADENTNSVINTETASNDVVHDVRSVMDNSETITKASAQTFSKPDKIQSLPEPTEEQTPLISSSNISKKPELQTGHHKAFSPKQIRPAITASENIRLICSISVAVLVMLADAGFPFLGSDAIKKIVLFRPFLLLLVTNITIVAAYSLLQKVKTRSTSEASFGNIGTVLEWGLLVKTGSSALFMDCSVYSVVLICGMGILQLFG